MARYTQADVDTLLAKMAAERTSLREGAAALSDTAAAGVPIDGEGEEQWSATEQLAHLWEMERTDLAWCRAALAQNGAGLTGLQGDPVAIPVQDAPRHTVGDFLPHLRAPRPISNARPAAPPSASGP